ncbi:MAG: DMT family transporter [Bacteroidales bacterium]|nr:DMT family transporter [Bacteroidales bacterium]
MLWLPLSFLTALFESLKDVVGKKNLTDKNVFVVAFALRLFALPFLLPILFFIEIPELNSTFFVAIFVGALLNVFITVLYMRAIQISDLSITAPMVIFTPLFLLITSPILLGEFPNGWGLLGIFLIVFGALLMHRDASKNGFFAPFKAMLSKRGPRYMLLVAFLWSLTANIDKICINNSSPMFYVVFMSSLLTVLMIPMVIIMAGNKMNQLKQIKSLAPIGIFTAATLIFQMWAVSLTLVTYVIAIKRSSALLSVLWGYLIFKEKDIRSRLVGTAIMFIGVLVIALLGT